MIQRIPYKADHLFQIELQDSQRHLPDLMDESAAASLEMAGWSFSVATDDGEVLGCAGVVPIWQDRGYAWSYVSKNAGRHFTYIHRQTLKFLRSCPLRRIEMAVDCDFEQGHRWATMLGFKLEAGRMTNYMPDGQDCSLYARIKV